MNIKNGIVKKLDLSQQIGAFKNLPEFFLLIWKCDRFLTSMNIFLRIVKAGIPISMLYVGKLIIDEILNISDKYNGVDIEISGLSILLLLVILELGLAIFSDLLGRGIAIVDSLLGDLVSHEISLRLMKQSSQNMYMIFLLKLCISEIRKIQMRKSTVLLNGLIILKKSINQIGL